MEQESTPDVKTIFQTLSEEGKKLLISMTHASHQIGMRMEAIQASSGLEDEQLGKALASLRENNLVQRGKLENQEFIATEEGDRFRLPIEVRRLVLTDIVRLDQQQVEEMLKI